MDPLLIRLQRALEGRYAVEHELARGGMACILLGRDLRLDRRVAIKVFERDPDVAASTERFLREIRIAAKLQHPNILPVFESGDAEGLAYYVMPYVVGGSLRERLVREGPLPIAEAVRIAREVAEALDHAHRAGVVHRDIKPDNIMLADGAAVVADFGIARAIEQGAAKVTDTGLAIGTPTYMSPEQSAASPQLDGRTDIYSLGCVLYEMLSGSPPFHGATPQLVMARHANDSAPPLGTVRRVPDALEATLQKALAKIPADRWPTGRAFSDALAGSVPTTATQRSTIPRSHRSSRIAAAVALIIIAAAIWRRWSVAGDNDTRLAGNETDSLPSVGVLPFRLIGDSAYGHVASGISEAIITSFIRVGGMRVPGFGTVSRYGIQSRDPIAIGRELGVANVLDGSVQVEGPHLRVMTNMIRVRDGRSLWVTKLDGEMANIFAMQDMISRSILDTLRVQLTPASLRVLQQATGTRNEAAYDDYMLGNAWYQKADPPSVRKAVAYFTSAARRDTAFAAPLLGLLRGYDLLANVEPNVTHVTDAGRDSLLRRARTLDPSSGEVRAFVAWNYARKCDTIAADREWREAIRLTPGSAELRRNYAVFLSSRDRAAEALKAARDAATLDRTSPWVQSVLAHTYIIAGARESNSARRAELFASALDVSERFLALDSMQWVSNAVRGAAEMHTGRLQAGIAHLKTGRHLGGDMHAMTTGYLGWAYGMAKQRTEALEIAKLLEQRVERGEASHWSVAYVYAGLGDTARVFEWIGKHPRSTDPYHAGPTDPVLLPFRSDARFARAIARACANF